MKMYLQEVEDWFDLVQNRDRRQVLVYAIISLRVPQTVGSFLSLRICRLLKDSTPRS
jgi:hypothetical protein